MSAHVPLVRSQRFTNSTRFYQRIRRSEDFRSTPRLRRPPHGSPALHNILGRGAGQLTTARRAWARLWGRPRPCGADSQRSLSTLRRNLRNWRRRPRASDDLSTGYQHSTTSSDVALATSWACATPQARALAGIWAVATTCRSGGEQESGAVEATSTAQTQPVVPQVAGPLHWPRWGYRRPADRGSPPASRCGGPVQADHSSTGGAHCFLTRKNLVHSSPYGATIRVGLNSPQIVAGR